MDDIKTQIRLKIQELQTTLRVLESLEPKAKPRTILTEVFDVLKESGKPMRLEDMRLILEAKGVHIKENSLRSALKQDAHKIGIVRAGRGLWWLRGAEAPAVLKEAMQLFRGGGSGGDSSSG